MIDDERDLESDELDDRYDRTCVHLQIIPMSWRGPKEVNCKHPETVSGECCKADCPLERSG